MAEIYRPPKLPQIGSDQDVINRQAVTAIKAINSQILSIQTKINNLSEAKKEQFKYIDGTYRGRSTPSRDGAVRFKSSNNTVITSIKENIVDLKVDGYKKEEIDTLLDDYYTITELQTSGLSQVHWDNITNTPTTIAGYGITDAYTDSEVDALIAAIELGDLADVDLTGINDNDILRYDLATDAWYPEALPSTSPGGLDTHVQYNNAGVFGGDAGFVYDKAGTIGLSANINLVNTTNATTGVITKGGDPFIHNYSDVTADGFNTFIGKLAGNFTMSPGGGSSALASYNTCIGPYSGNSLTTGNRNCLISDNAGISLTTGSRNLFIGGSAGYSETNGQNLVYFGYQAGYNSNGSGGAVVIGYRAGYNITAMAYSILIGESAGYGLTSGSSVIAIGYRAGYNLGSSGSQILIGHQAGYNTTAGNNSTIIGYEAGYTDTTTYRALYIGYRAGYYETSSDRLYIGNTSPSNLGDGRNKAIIHGLMDAATTANQDLWLHADTRISVDDTTSPTERFEVDGNIWLFNDSDYLYFGAGKDVRQYYDGTDFYTETDLVAASDWMIDCGTDKTIELVETVWEDLQFEVTSGKQPTSSAPTWATLTTNTGEFGFDIDNYTDLSSEELNHKWKEGTTGNFHLHISIPDANASGSSRYAQFILYVAYVNASNIWTETSLTAEKEIPDGSSALENFYLDMGDVSFAGLTIGTQVKCRVKRIAATGGTEYGSNVFIHQVGCHLEQNTLGSRTEAAK